MKEPLFASTDEQFYALKEQLEADGVGDIKPTRFRGIGSVGEDTLAHFCTDLKTRQLSLLTSTDAEVAIRIFEELRNIMKPDA